MKKIMILMTVLLLSSCKTATVSTSSNRWERSLDVLRDTVNVYDSVSVRSVVVDSVHYVYNDHYRDKTKVVYRNKSDTVVVTDTVVRTLSVPQHRGKVIGTGWWVLVICFVVLVLFECIRNHWRKREE